MTNPYDPKPDSKDQNPANHPDKEDGEKPRLSLDDLVSRDAKAFVPFDQNQAAAQKLPGSDLNKLIGKGLTPELGRELSGQKASPNLKWQSIIF